MKNVAAEAVGGGEEEEYDSWRGMRVKAEECTTSDTFGEYYEE